MNGKIVGLIALISVLTLTVVVVSAAPNVDNHQPEYVECTYDESTLEKYKPQLQTDHLQIEPVNLYGSYCQSNESDEDVAMYFAYYTHQEGFSDADSHKLDREPIYVFIDEDTGEVNRTSYTAYHYIKGDDRDPHIVDDSQVVKYVVGPHNHYISPSTGTGTQYDLRDFDEVHQDWYNNGWKANPEVTANPYEIDNHDSWWSEDNAAWDFQAAEWYWELRLTIQSLNPFSDEPENDIE